MQINITSDEIAEDELQQLLNQRLGKDEARNIFIQSGSVRLRGADPAVVVALVSASSAAIGALLTGLLQIAKERCSGRITLQGSDGSRIDVPANTSPEKFDALIENIRKMSQPRVHIGS
jgi:hypothetical protein